MSLVGKSVTPERAAKIWVGSDYRESDLAYARYVRDLLLEVGSDVRYIEGVGYLLYWDGVWTVDADSIRLRAWVHTAAEGVLHSYDSVGKKMDAFSRKISGSMGIDGAVKEIRALAGVLTDIEDFDTHNHLLCVRNGVVDLRLKKLLPHDPSYLFTKQVGVNYNEDAAATRWEKFVSEVFPDASIAAFMQRLLGYAITGETSEQAFSVFYGDGANGKSVLQGVFGDVFEGITSQVPFEIFESKGGSGSPEIAALRGARIVMTSEGEAGKPMKEALLKRLSGDERITARALYQSPISFVPHFKIFMASNAKPSFRGVDHGLWRRVKLIPFVRTFSVEERDYSLQSKLMSEAQGILAWAVDGAAQWYANGLCEPAAIVAATSEYRHSEDALSEWALQKGWQLGGADGEVRLTDLFKDYDTWCYENRVDDALRTRAFQRSIEARKGVRKIRKSSGTIYKGVAKSLTNNEEAGQ